MESIIESIREEPIYAGLIWASVVLITVLYSFSAWTRTMMGYKTLLIQRHAEIPVFIVAIVLSIYIHWVFVISHLITGVLTSLFLRKRVYSWLRDLAMETLRWGEVTGGMYDRKPPFHTRRFLN